MSDISLEKLVVDRWSAGESMRSIYGDRELGVTEHLVRRIVEGGNLSRNCKRCGLVEVGRKRLYCALCRADESKDLKRQSYDNHLQVAKERSADWYEKNKERFQETNKAWHDANRDKSNAAIKRWKLKHLDKLSQYSAKRRANFYGAFVEGSVWHLSSIYRRWNGVPCGPHNSTFSRRRAFV